MKATEQYFPVVLFIMLYKVVLTFESVDEILWCDHPNETSPALLSQCPVCFSAFFKEKFGIFERATSFSQLTTHLPSKFLDILFNISIHHHLAL